MNYFVVSDIHGQFNKLVYALNKAGFYQSNVNHKLIICGDLFDRGSQNAEVYQYIKALQEVDRNKVVVIKGNHEVFFEYIINGQIKERNIFENLLYNGFGKTLSSFTHLDLPSLFYQIHEIKEIIELNYPELMSWITHLSFYYETKNYVFTHAGIDYLADNWRLGNWNKQVWANLNEFQSINLRHYGFNKKLVMGHYYTSRLTFKEHDDIFFHQDNQKIFIDGGAAKGSRGKINVLVIEDEEL